MNTKWKEVWHPSRKTTVMVNEENGEICSLTNNNILDEIMKDFFDTVKEFMDESYEEDIQQINVFDHELKNGNPILMIKDIGYINQYGTMS